MNGTALPLVPAADVEAVLERSAPLWRALAGERLLITGGTGFMGAWLLESLVHARARLGIDLRAVVLSRAPEAFRLRAPALAANPALEFVAGDVRDFGAPGGAFGAVIHAATDTRADAERDDPAGLAASIVDGTRRVLDCAAQAGAARFLYLSSGAVYGAQPPDLAGLPEEHCAVSEARTVGTTYADAKRDAEALCVAAADGALQPTIARCFAFVGAQLPLDGHFAVGNFLRDAAEGRGIEVLSDGRPVRSYLHGIDLTVWLLTVLLHGRAGQAYNVGSDESVSVGELARAVAALATPPVAVLVRTPFGTGPAPRYVPSIERARRELGLDITIQLPDALRRTLIWAREARRSSNLH